ncbi:MAG: outer membrane lipid asymmetry maintenance protein MlaD [Deltaproteobacteria bacterium]|nr:outer membrane lipid asymmetry maintenance protein MlaD [Deltaproteobacteria bacterium]MBW1948815.1 outer membrane lipid asymmetry maintenance protein MlaD [Deltaproteobacteria bacterium]MBW2346286.1 outer membrane lipid asymmetry maintenance protein MlaD [Deltaproteobacteria bacterium]
MRKLDLELAVGVFMIAGILCLGYLSIKLGRMEVLGGDGYEIEAVFSNVGGLKTGSSVVIAGVEVGRVKKVVLDDYEARTVIALPTNLKIQEDAIASVKTKGLIGEKYVEITPGGSDRVLKPGERIRETQSAVDLEQLISNYVFGKL